MKNLKLITNVGYVKDSPNGTFNNAYLALSSSNEYCLVGHRAAFNDGSTNIPAQWVIIKPDFFQNSGTSTNIADSILQIIVTPVWNNNEELVYAGLAVGVVTGGSEFVTGSGNPAFVNHHAALANVPAKYSLKGTGITDAQIEELGLNELPTLAPIQGDFPIGNAAPVVSLNPFPTFDKLPIEAVKAAFGNPIEYAKANPISAGVMVLGIVQVGNFAGLWSPNPLGLVGIKSRTTKKKAALGF